MVDIRIDGDLRNPDSINLLDHDIRLRQALNQVSAGDKDYFSGYSSRTFPGTGSYIFDNYTSRTIDAPSFSVYFEWELSNANNTMDTVGGTYTAPATGTYLVQAKAVYDNTTIPTSHCSIWAVRNFSATYTDGRYYNLQYNLQSGNATIFGDMPVGLGGNQADVDDAPALNTLILPLQAGDTLGIYAVTAGSITSYNTFLFLRIQQL